MNYTLSERIQDSISNVDVIWMAQLFYLCSLNEIFFFSQTPEWDISLYLDLYTDRPGDTLTLIEKKNLYIYITFSITKKKSLYRRGVSWDFPVKI